MRAKWPITDLNSGTVTAVKNSNHMKKNRRIFVRRSIGVCAVTIAASLFLQPVLTRAQTASPATKEASAKWRCAARRAARFRFRLRQLEISSKKTGASSHRLQHVDRAQRSFELSKS